MEHEQSKPRKSRPTPKPLDNMYFCSFMTSFFYIYNQMILFCKIKVNDISPAITVDALPKILNNRRG